MEHQPLSGFWSDAGELGKLLNRFGDLWGEERHTEDVEDIVDGGKIEERHDKKAPCQYKD